MALVEAIDQLSGRDRQLSWLTPGPPTLTETGLRHIDYGEAQDLYKKVAEGLKARDVNIVIAFPVNSKGQDGGAGAGHAEQGLFAAQFFNMIGLGDRTTIVPVELNSPQDGVNPLMQFIDISYAFLQDHASLYQAYLNVTASSWFDGLVKKQTEVNGRSVAGGIAKKLTDIAKQKRSTFDPKKPTVFIGPHPWTAEAGAYLINTGFFQAGSVDYDTAPDPWDRGQLNQMIANSGIKPDKGQLIAVLHDTATAITYQDIRSYAHISALPLGTWSSPELLLSEPEPRSDIELHTLIWSGNYIKSLDEDAARLLEQVLAREIKQNDKVHLVLHFMQHKKSEEFIRQVLTRLKLDKLIWDEEKNPTGRIRLMRDETMWQAVQSRDDLLMGRIKELGLPIFVWTKGGEQVLKQTPRYQLPIAISGFDGHQGTDIETGVCAGRAVSFQNLHATQWLEVAREIQKKRAEHNHIPQSLVPLALLEYLEPGSVMKLLTKKQESIDPIRDLVVGEPDQTRDRITQLTLLALIAGIMSVVYLKRGDLAKIINRGLHNGE